MLLVTSCVDAKLVALEGKVGEGINGVAKVEVGFLGGGLGGRFLLLPLLGGGLLGLRGQVLCL